MTSKAKLRARIADLQRQVALGTRMEFETLTVDFPERTVTYQGRVMKTEQDRLSMPILSTRVFP